MSNRRLTPATPRFVKSQGALSATPGLATLGLGTHQLEGQESDCFRGSETSCAVIILAFCGQVLAGKDYTK